ncbi:MAG: serine/threonine protein kinase [Desulfoprunum sp.]|nr:serine/threonine protein kinase [Desulfoprunum sp.]
MKVAKKNKHEPFTGLGPDLVLGLAEQALGVRCTNMFRPLTSYINRVFELEQVNKQGLVIKFYRPGRWSEAALLDEHAFLLELADQEIPVVAPLVQQNGSTLGSAQGLSYAVFPKRGGRSCDEYTDEQWLEIGRLLGRVHNIGALRAAPHRLILGPDHSAAEQLAYLLAGDRVQAELRDQLQEVSEAILSEIRPLFAGCEQIRIHGDCHFANMIHRPGESFILIDFDDMVTGPPMQDLWMLLPGDVSESFVEIDLFIEGYETFRPFDRRALRLVEPLRALRYIHYMAWCARQAQEDGDTRAIDGFGSREYWQKEIGDLKDQLLRIRQAPSTFGNML